MLHTDTLDSRSLSKKERLAFRLSKKSLFDKALILYLLLLSMDAMLRLGMESNISLSKVVVIISLIGFFLFFNIRAAFFFFSLSFILLYSFVVGYIGEYGISGNLLRFSAHYFFAFSCSYFGYVCAHRLDRARLYKIVVSFLFITSLTCIIAWVYGFSFPNIQEKQSVIRGWFWNENDIAMLSVATIFVLYKMKTKESSKILLSFLLAAAILTSYVNEAKVVILALLLFVFLNFTYKISNAILYNGGQRARKSLFFSLLIVQGLIGFFVVREFDSFYIFEPLARLLTLNPYEIPLGSIYNRTDAAIYSIYGFFDSYFAGIGAGNSIDMIVGQVYGPILSAGSLHNLPLQMFVEFGAIFIFLLFVFLRKVGTVSVIIFWAPFILNSVSQSSGIFSNYVFFFLAGVAFVIVRDEQLEERVNLRNNLK